MSFLVSHLAALALGLAGPPDARADFLAVAISDSLAVYDEAEETAYSSGDLRKGDRVVVRDADSRGWLTIDPPLGSFDWIEQRAIKREEGEGKARVVVPVAAVRSGRPNALMPGSRRGALGNGATVRLIDRPSLQVGGGNSRTTWVAVEPMPGEVRYVRAEGVRRLVETSELEPVRETRAAYAPTGSTEGLPAQTAAEVGRIDAMHRAALAGAVEEWRLAPIREGLESLSSRVADAAARSAIRERLAVVERHEAMAESARKFQTILQRSRRRDRQLALIHRRLAAAARPESRSYEAEGMVQPSARRVKGQRVYALIGPEGTTLAYLDVPPGLDPRPMVTRRVGVRGAVHYDEGLRAKLISVSELELIDDDR